MTQKFEEIAAQLIAAAHQSERFMVAIAGPPGAGKSTLAENLLKALGELGERSAIIPMDGYHLDNAILDSRGLLARKGSPQTFDADGFVSLVHRLSDPKLNGDVVIPVFDRSRDIAIAGAQIVAADTRFLLFEGNYLLLKEIPWGSLNACWDYKVFIDPGLDVIEQRLIRRWLDHGFDADRAKSRALENDIPNARHVLQHSTKADLRIDD
ncbi:MAG: nucleoside/nucleotide kinase family protein [Rhizobiaceae bacterium]|nr:nucleoside/nucleotide kinase family protein [Rhizobiaceae bacterium]